MFPDAGKLKAGIAFHARTTASGTEIARTGTKNERFRLALSLAG
ncbi:MAG TPA: hypothetical protein VNR60_09745 [Croceibacterium sp.]|nr:hypothetical protein [Croceibacterium sp.]